MGKWPSKFDRWYGYAKNQGSSGGGSGGEGGGSGGGITAPKPLLDVIYQSSGPAQVPVGSSLFIGPTTSEWAFQQAYINGEPGAFTDYPDEPFAPGLYWVYINLGISSETPGLSFGVTPYLGNNNRVNLGRFGTVTNQDPGYTFQTLIPVSSSVADSAVKLLIDNYGDDPLDIGYVVFGYQKLA